MQWSLKLVTFRWPRPSKSKLLNEGTLRENFGLKYKQKIINVKECMYSPGCQISMNNWLWLVLMKIANSPTDMKI